ncbi:MAG: class I SAM-dependent methyltransferase, partial [Candidatus Eremiobacteraeota bacterium]|nr:class I SAM-dependent methyltransferase [Candidatus Eremiobacteraeota bacterium]
FCGLLAHVPSGAIPNATFVDVGAGMGRAVLLATEYPFQAVIGIELSPSLHEIARDNVARVRGLATRCRDVRLVRADARRARFPRGDLVVFLYNPFDGQALDDVLDRIAERSGGGSVWVLYHVPVHGDRLVARGYEVAIETQDGTVYLRR